MRLYIPNPNFVREIDEQAETRESYVEIANEVKTLAEPMVAEVGGPWMPRVGQSEPVAVGEDEDGVYVALTEHGGAIIEYGGKNNPPHAPLRRAARAAGLEVDEDL